MSKLLIATLMGVAMTGAAMAGDYPDKPVHIVVPFAAGGGSDVVARLAADQLEKALGQQMIVENKPGASGSIGTRVVADAPPDGYTMLHTSSSFVVNPSLYKDPGYEIGQFTPVFRAVSNCSIAVANPAAGFDDIDGMIAAAKQGSLNFGTAGVGSTPFLFAEALFKLAGVEATHVPYQGGAPALTAVLGNQVPVIFVTFATGNVVELIEKGELKGIVTTCDKRSERLPDVPTILETKYAAYGTDATWGSFFVPAGTPKDIVDRLNKELNDIFSRDPVKSRIDAMGLTFEPNTADEFGAQVEREAREWADRVAAIGLEKQ